MNIADFLEKFGRNLFERPLAAAPRPDEPPELAEIRLAVLDRVREKSYPSGGRRVFPFDLLRIRMSGLEESRRAVYAGSFFRKYMEQEVHGALRNMGCRFPENLRVQVEASASLPRPGEQWLSVEAAASDSGAGGPAPRLVVREGKANAAEILLDKPRINIGRTVDVYRSEGIFRRNDLAFAEDTDVNRSVSREHAHIVWDRATGEYRLFNDRWYERGTAAECGIRIVRDGLSVAVPRDSRGTRLEPGDEIHLGRAVVMFEAE
jgi:hypothetical protein